MLQFYYKRTWIELERGQSDQKDWIYLETGAETWARNHLLLSAEAWRIPTYSLRTICKNRIQGRWLALNAYIDYSAPLDRCGVVNSARSRSPMISKLYWTVSYVLTLVTLTQRDFIFVHAIWSRLGTLLRTCEQMQVRDFFHQTRFPWRLGTRIEHTSKFTQLGFSTHTCNKRP